jgi:hypothetical protein
MRRNTASLLRTTYSLNKIVLIWKIKMTSQLIYQRIRNRIIETLELLIEYENKFPKKIELNELVNLWEDWVNSPLKEDEFPMPVYTELENKLLREVCAAIENFCEITPQLITDEEQAMALSEWSSVIKAAQLAHTMMMKN